MFSEGTIQRPQQSLLALRKIRESIRMAVLLDGTVAGITLVLFLLVLAFILDYLLDLPPAVRVIHSLISLGFLYWFLSKRLFRPGRISLSDEDLAVLLEARIPELEQALITAVELTRPGHRGSPYLSSELLSRVVTQAEEAKEALQPRRILNFRPLRQNALLLGGVAFLMAGGVLFRPDLTGIWFQRFILLKDQDWPKNTELVLVQPNENPVQIARGDDLLVEVKAVRGDPPSVEIVARSDAARWRDPMFPGAEGLFRKVMENVPQSFRFRAVGGDDETAEVQVLVRILPILTRLDVWYRYPDYTGLSPTPLEKPVRNPSLIKVPAGTLVALRGYTDLPVKEAFFTFKSLQDSRGRTPANSGGKAHGSGGDSSAGGAKETPWPDPEAKMLEVYPAVPKPTPLDPGGEPAMPPEKVQTMFDQTFPVEGDGSFFFQLRSADGFPGRRGKIVSVRAIPDRPPIVKITEPRRASEEVSREATVAMEFLIRDNYSVKSASLEGMVVPRDRDEGKLESYPLELSPHSSARASSDPGSEYRPEFTLELSKYTGLSPGAKFEYYAQATDSGGNTGRSEGYVLHILSKEDIKRILNDRLMLLRDQLREIAREEESARKDLLNYQQKLLGTIGDNELILDASAATKLIRNRQDQERITQRLGRLVNEFDGILSRMESNRVGEEKEKAWIGDLRREVEGFSLERSPAIARAIEALRSEATASPQPPARISPIADEQFRLERDINLLAFRLTEFGDVNWVIQQLQDVKRRQQEIRNHTRVRAIGSEKKTGGGGEENP